MFPKNLRLDSKEIPVLARKGKRFDNEYFFIRAWFDDSLDSPKFAISISVKVDKLAVVRNRIKRKIHASVVDVLNQNIEIKKGKYLIVVKSKDLKDLENIEIGKLLSPIFVHKA